MSWVRNVANGTKNTQKTQVCFAVAFNKYFGVTITGSLRSSAKFKGMQEVVNISNCYLTFKQLFLLSKYNLYFYPPPKIDKRIKLFHRVLVVCHLLEQNQHNREAELKKQVDQRRQCYLQNTLAAVSTGMNSRELLIPSFHTASEVNRPLQQSIVEVCPENLNKILNKNSGVSCCIRLYQTRNKDLPAWMN